MTLTTDQLNGLGAIMEDVLAELRGLRADLAERSASVSSAEVKQTSKEVALTVKKYDGSLTPVDSAIEDFAHGMREIQRLQASNWAETVAGALNGGGKPA